MTSRHVILFDADCRLCSATARFVLDHNRRCSFRLVPVRSAAGGALCRRFAIDPEAPATMLVVRNGGAAREGDAVLALLRGLGGGWRLLAGVLGFVPRRLRDSAYRLVARNRYRWFGRCACAPSEGS